VIDHDDACLAPRTSSSCSPALCRLAVALLVAPKLVAPKRRVGWCLVKELSARDLGGPGGADFAWATRPGGVGRGGVDPLPWTIELVRKGRTPESLAEQFEPTAQTIRNWLAQADRDAGQRPDGVTTDEREQLRRLRRENKTLREERAI
jgi:transposase